MSAYQHTLCDEALVKGILFLACENCQNVSLGVVKSSELGE